MGGRSNRGWIFIACLIAVSTALTLAPPSATAGSICPEDDGCGAIVGAYISGVLALYATPIAVASLVAAIAWNIAAKSEDSRRILRAVGGVAFLALCNAAFYFAVLC